MDRTFIDRGASDFERRKARDTAQAVLDGRITVLEAARALVSLAHTDAVPDVEDRKLIIAVESETDHLPVGEVRKLWAPDALKEGTLTLHVQKPFTETTFCRLARESPPQIAPQIDHNKHNGDFATARASHVA